MKTFKLLSVKGTRMIEGTLADAIEAAIEMDLDLQPSFGVSIEDEGGETVADIRDGTCHRGYPRPAADQS